MPQFDLELLCPHCQQNIDVNEEVSKQIRESFQDERQDIEKKVREEMGKSHTSEIEKLKASLGETNKQLLSTTSEQEKKDLEIQKLRHSIETGEEKLSMELEKATILAKQEAMKEYRNELGDIEKKVREEMGKSHTSEIEKLKASLGETNKQLLSTTSEQEKKDLEIQKLRHSIETGEEKLSMELEKATILAKQEAMKEYSKMAEEIAEQKSASLKMENNELANQLRQQKELHKEALRKASQGSVQSQGEGAEIYIEQILSAEFPLDTISEVKTGTRGADVLQTVRFGSGVEAGIIVWEVKRTKDWANRWIAKVKEDTTKVGGHISVIVSEALPSGVSRMKMIDENVWVCRFVEVGALATALRVGLIRAQSVARSQEGKGSKMEHLYDYMSSQEFSNAMRLIDDSYVAELDIIEKERRSMERNWSGRRKAAEARLKGFAEFIGTVKTIATELPVIKELESSDRMALPGLEDDAY